MGHVIARLIQLPNRAPDSDAVFGVIRRARLLQLFSLVWLVHFAHHDICNAPNHEPRQRPRCGDAVSSTPPANATSFELERLVALAFRDEDRARDEARAINT